MQISEMAADGTVDFAIATEALELFSDLIDDAVLSLEPLYSGAPRSSPHAAVKTHPGGGGGTPIVTYVLLYRPLQAG